MDRAGEKTRMNATLLSMTRSGIDPKQKEPFRALSVVDVS